MDGPGSAVGARQAVGHTTFVWFVGGIGRGDEDPFAVRDATPINILFNSTDGPGDQCRSSSRTFSRCFRRTFSRYFRRTFCRSLPVGRLAGVLEGRCLRRSSSRSFSRCFRRTFCRSPRRSSSRTFSRCFRRTFCRTLRGRFRGRFGWTFGAKFGWTFRGRFGWTFRGRFGWTFSGKFGWTLNSSTKQNSPAECGKKSQIWCITKSQREIRS
jgi:hypothetical protein